MRWCGGACTDRLDIFLHTRASSRTGRGIRDRTRKGEHGDRDGAGRDLELEPVGGERGLGGERGTRLRHSAHESGCFFVFLSSCRGRLLACIIEPTPTKSDISSTSIIVYVSTLISEHIG